MPFTQGFAFQDLKSPGKNYEHSTFREQFGYRLSEHHSREMLCQALSNPSSPKKIDYFISILWSDGRLPLLDVFTYKLDNPSEWKGNAGELSWVVERGIWRRLMGDEENTCEERHRIISEELDLRRKIPKEKYLKNIVNVNRVNEELEFKF